MSQYPDHCEGCQKGRTRNLDMSEAEKTPIPNSHCSGTSIHQFVSGSADVTSKKI